MKLNDAVQSLIDAGDWLGLVAYYWALAGQNPYGHLLIVGVPLVLTLGCVVLSMTAPNPTNLTIRDKPLPPVSTKGYKPRGPVYIPLQLGKVTIDLQPTRTDTIHTVIAGATGLGKSTAVLPLFDLPIGVLCIALDNTRPISAKVREVDGIEWTNEPEQEVGLDLLSGEPRIASEVLVAGWAAKTAQDTGKWRDIAANRVWQAMVEHDRLGIDRTLPELAATLMQRTGNAEADRACQDWAGRLERLAWSLGPALAPDLDLVDAMRRQQKVLLRLNRFSNPRLAPMLGGMLLVHARRVAEEANVPFVLIVEEAGQLELYSEQIVPLAQAGRDRGVPLILLTQNASVLPLEVQNNVSVWVSFAQEAKRELNFAAERLRLESEHLIRETFPGDQGRGWCYVRAPGLPTTLVHVSQQRPVKRSPAKQLPGEIGTVGTGPQPTTGPRIVVREMLNDWDVKPLALPVPRQEPVPYALQTSDGLRIWGKLQRTGQRTPLWHPTRGLWWAEDGCLAWTRGTNGTRPKSSIGPRSITVYKWVYEQVVGPVPEGLTLDHMCGDVMCCDWTHLDPCTLEENNRREGPRHAAIDMAWRVERKTSAVAAD